MQMTGEERIAAPREKVWAALNDPAVLRQCIPGCETLEAEGQNRLKATVSVKIGPIGARFSGVVTLSEIDAANGYRITGEGQGGTVGSARGGARVRLADAPGGGTLLSYEVEADVAGRIAQLGGPLIDATARQLAAAFFRKFGQVVAGAAPAVKTHSESTAYAPHPPLPWAWLVVLALAILAGFLLGRSDLAGGWVVAVIALALASAAAGFAAGRGAGR